MIKKIITGLVIFLFLAISNISGGGLKVLHEKTFSVSKGELLELSASVGNIKVTTWDKDELYVKIIGNDRAEDKIKFSFEETSSGVEIRAEKRGNDWFNWGSGLKLNFEIRLPSTFDTELKTSGGNVYVSDLSGNNDIRTSGGDVTTTDVNGKLVIKTSGGKIVVDKHEGVAELSTSGGDIDVKSHVGDLEASTSGGDVELNVASGKIKASTSGGDMRVAYKGQNEGISLGTSGGDIKLLLPEDFAAELECKTSGGRVKNELRTTKVYRDKKSVLEAEVNGGGNLVRARTSGGDIIIRVN